MHLYKNVAGFYLKKNESEVLHLNRNVIEGHLTLLNIDHKYILELKSLQENPLTVESQNESLYVPLYIPEKVFIENTQKTRGEMNGIYFNYNRINHFGQTEVDEYCKNDTQ